MHTTIGKDYSTARVTFNRKCVIWYILVGISFLFLLVLPIVGKIISYVGFSFFCFILSGEFDKLYSAFAAARRVPGDLVKKYLLTLLYFITLFLYTVSLVVFYVMSTLGNYTIIHATIIFSVFLIEIVLFVIMGIKRKLRRKK